MNSIDDDARLIGIDEEVWRKFRQMTERYEQPDLDGFAKAEAEAREASVDREAFIRRKQALAKRWFGYYRKCKDPEKKNKLIDEYNWIAIRGSRERN